MPIPFRRESPLYLSAPSHSHEKTHKQAITVNTWKYIHQCMYTHRGISMYSMYIRMYMYSTYEYSRSGNFLADHMRYNCYIMHGCWGSLVIAASLTLAFSLFSFDLLSLSSHSCEQETNVRKVYAVPRLGQRSPCTEVRIYLYM